MRKASAIFLLIIYVYNLIGYKAFFSYLEQKATSSLISKLDNGQYSNDELVEVKVPVNSLYYHGSNEYVRYDGTIEIKGRHFNYVKRKFINDTLYLLCIPNEVTNKLATARTNFYDNTAEADGTAQHKSKAGATAGAKTFSSDYNFPRNTFEFIAPASSLSKHFVAVGSKLPTIFISSLYKPPRQAA